MRGTIAAAVVACALATAAAAGPLVHVTGVADDDSLNLRAEPDANSARVGTIDAHDTKIEVIAVDTKGADWVKVRKGKVSGWVNAKFLAYEAGLPVTLKCVGTEPFWGIDLGYQFAAVDFSGMDGGKRKVGFMEPVAGEGHSWPWLVRLNDKASAFLLVTKHLCSDDMSDTSYPYFIAVSLDGRFVDGCCK